MTTSIALVLLVFPAAAYAQQVGSGQTNGSQTGTASSQGATVGEVVVTAQRRAESVQTVPLAVQVTTGLQLQQRHITDTTALASVTPTLNFTGGSAPSNVSVSLRGIASLANQPGVQPSTSLVVDDVPLVRQGEYVAKLSDISSIQILDGPQGTLFGKNSTAGVINVVTMDPVNHFDGWLEGGATNDDEYSVRGMLNVPLTDKIQARVNVYYDDQSPLIRNLDPLGNDVAGDTSDGVEAKLAYKVTPKLTVLATLSYNRDRSSYEGEIPIDLSSNANEASVLGYTPHYGLALINQNTPDLALTEFYSGTLRINYEFNDSLSVTSVTSYHDFQAQSILDTDTTPIGNNVGIGFTLNPLNYSYQTPEYFYDLGRFTDKVNYWSEEDRINYNSRLIKFVGGIFYQNVSGYTRDLSPTISGGDVKGTFSDNGVQNAPYSDKTASVFGDATVNITKTISAFGGLRYTREQTYLLYEGAVFKNPVADFNPVTGVNSAPPISTHDLIGGETKYNLSGRTGLQWQPTSDVNVYVSYARGYKGPGLGLAGNQTTNTYLNVNPELADDYEFGSKLRFFDRRVALDLSLFDETIYNIQESTIVPGTVITELINAGSLHSRGITGNLEARVTDHFDLSGGLSVLDNYYGNFLFSCSPQGAVGVGSCFKSTSGAAVQNLDHQRAIEAPPLKYTLSARYRGQVPGLPVDYVAELDWIWTGKIQYSLNEAADTLAPSYGLLNASLDFRSQDGHYDLLFYGKNLTNKFFYDNLVDAPTAFGVAGQVSRDFQIYGGATIRYHF
jgi:iron complex outermembrane receptor protein